MEVLQMISKQYQIKVFGKMVELILAKGAKNKMISVFDIADGFKADTEVQSKVLIEATLDVLIGWKYVRYYRNEKGYIYYGITKLAWERWELRVGSVQLEHQISIDEVELRQAESDAVNESVVETPKRKRGRPRKITA